MRKTESSKESPDPAEERKRKAEEQLQHAAGLHLTPTQIAKRLREYVVGQDEAVRAVSTYLATHLSTNVVRAASGMPHIPPVERLPNLLLVGPTGCGKSQLLRAAATQAGLPWTIADATQLTETGWVGETAGDWLRGLLTQASGNTPYAEVGLLMVDELDKRVAVPGPHKDISGAGAQDALLRLLDHAVVNVEMQDGPGSRRYVPVRTQAMLIMLAGAFVGAEDHVARRLRGRGRLGFSSDADPTRGLSATELRAMLAPQDLISMGIKPEIAGRVGRIVVMNDLDRFSMRKILTEIYDGPVKTLNAITAKLGFSLSYPDRLVEAIIDRAVASGLGARALHTYAAKAAEKALHEVPDMVQRQGHRASGTTVVQLRSDSLDNGYFAIRPAANEGGVEVEAPPPARARRTARAG